MGVLSVFSARSCRRIFFRRRGRAVIVTEYLLGSGWSIFSLFASCARSVGHGRRSWGGRGVVAGGTVGAGVAEGLVVVARERVWSCSVSTAKCACCRVSCSLGG